MNAVFGFLAGPTGRWVRAVAGIALIVIGLALVHGALGWILAIIGLVPLGAGLFDKCVFAPLFGLPFAGPALRRALEDKK
jgi:Zn-dependent membrane protease YugP